MRSTRHFTLYYFVAAALLTLSTNAFSTTVAVGTCTSLANYGTIQQAITATASSPGAVIKVCPGTYPEQVVISQSVTLQGIVSGNQELAIIVPPSGGVVQNATDLDNPAMPIAAQILVQGAGPVSITNLTVDGAGNGVASCGLDIQGILFQNASGTVNHVAVRNQVPGAGFGGCQIGESIFVQTAAGLVSSVTIQNSSVHNYNKNGITGNDAGTTLTVMGNYVQGAGVVASGGAAQNGIQLGFGATGRIANNSVTDNIYGDTTVAASADILLYDTAENSGISVTNNVVSNSQFPIVLYADTAGVGDGVTLTGNKVFSVSSFDGIDLCTNGNTVKSNSVFNSARSGIHIDTSCGAAFGGSTGTNNTITNNTVLESACAGLLDDTNGVGSNTIAADNYWTVPFTLTASTSRCNLGATAASPKVKASRSLKPAR
jgi:hypothetical protein